MQARAAQLPLRVTSISPGLVATEFSRSENHNHDAEAGKETHNKTQALQPHDVAQAILYVLAAPDHVDVSDLLMRPIDQRT